MRRLRSEQVCEMLLVETVTLFPLAHLDNLPMAHTAIEGFRQKEAIVLRVYLLEPSITSFVVRQWDVLET